MSRACVEVESLLDKRAGGLDEAERLVLDAHLAECARCRGTAALMLAVREAMAEVPSTLSERVRERAIDAAFAGAARVREPKMTRRLVWPAAGALVAAAATALVMWVPRGEQIARHAAPVPAPVAEVSAPSEPVAQDAVEEAAAPSWVQAEGPEIRRFAHAEVELEQSTRVRFEPRKRRLELVSGRVRVDVDASRGESFEVQTQHFRVVVLGTRFSVAEDSVSVEHGRVQVFDRVGEVLARELGPGSTFSYGHAARERPKAQPSPRALLSRAREALSRGDVGAARAYIARAEEGDPSRADRAEASTLRAECALLQRDAASAVKHYLSVASRFGDLPAGENAAFAAAQIAERAHGKARAAQLYARYLARYPRGRFAVEAKAQLGQRAAE